MVPRLFGLAVQGTARTQRHPAPDLRRLCQKLRNDISGRRTRGARGAQGCIGAQGVQLGGNDLRPFDRWDDGLPQTELNFKLYRQATDKIVGLSDDATAFLHRFFPAP